PNTRSVSVLAKLVERVARNDPDVVMGTGLDAVQAEGAVHVAGLALLEEVELAAVLDQAAALGIAPAADAVLGQAVLADVVAAHLDFEGRGQRVDEVELADRADVLAEGRALEEAVDDEGGREVGQRHPGGQPGALPEVERFVDPEE